MLEFKQGNLLEADTEAIINAVNCVGVMGKGIALQFKQAYPHNFTEYERACKANDLQLGKMFIVKNHSLLHPQYIINFPTKRHWKDKSKIEDIEQGLVDLVQQLKVHDIASVAIPALGCGYGGLEWNAVRPLIEMAAEKIQEVKFIIYLPSG